MLISGVKIFLGTTYPNQPAMVFYVQQELPRKPDIPGEGISRRYAVDIESSIIVMKNNDTNFVRQYTLRSKL